MTKHQVLNLLRRALNQPEAELREGQWEAIAALVLDRAQLLVVQRTGWGKSVVYFLATRLLRDQGKGPDPVNFPLAGFDGNQVRHGDPAGGAGRDHQFRQHQ